MTAGTYETPQLVVGGHAWSTISAGSAHSCGVTTDGDGYCWGQGMSGRLGNGETFGPFPTPQSVAGGHTWETINAAAGSSYTCGTTTDGDEYCWGLGYGDTPQSVE